MGGESPLATAGETAIVVAVEHPALERVYRDAYPSFHALGVPLHVTLLYPFVPTTELDAALPSLGEALVTHPRFTFALTELRTFPRAVWVAPEPAEPFRALTAAIEAAFPEHLHWGGAFDEVIPHLTLADGIAEADLEPTLARLRARVEPLLPVELAAEEATVLAEQADGRWQVAARLPFAGPAGVTG